MRSFASLASTVACLSLFTVVGSVACGSDGSGDGDGNGNGNGASGDASNVFSSSTGDFDAGSLAACATSQSGATLTPVNLVFLYDKSGSMGDKSRWFSCSGAVKVVQCSSFNVPVGPSPRYICFPQGQEANLGSDPQGNIGLNNKVCATGTVGGDAAVLCSNPATCTLAEFFDPAAKWQPVGLAMKGFFADPKSTGISASIGFFPKAGSKGALCQLSDYTTPAVNMTALPNGTAFKAAIEGQSPSGSTPTQIALSGAISYARTVAAAKPNEATAIVLVSDGDPTVCGTGVSQSISQVKAVAQAAATDAKQPIKTYVIGVGDSLTNLNQIAAAGGTTSATLVSAANPSQTSSDFQEALEKIRGQALSCDVPLPQPPDGKQLDVNAVNVVATISGKEDVLAYNKECAGGAGWHYDNVDTPTRVQLCDGTCKAIRADAGGKLAITFGCATKGGVIR